MKHKSQNDETSCKNIISMSMGIIRFKWAFAKQSQNNVMINQYNKTYTKRDFY